MDSLSVGEFGSPSSSILIPFHFRWYEPLLSGKVSVVFRKTGPTKMTPKKIYLYIGTPLSAVVGSVEVEDHSVMPVKEAVRLASAGGLQTLELEGYAGEYEKLHVFRIRRVVHFSRELPFQELRERFSFWPPRGFSILSTDGVAALDDLSRDESRC